MFSLSSLPSWKATARTVFYCYKFQHSNSEPSQSLREGDSCLESELQSYQHLCASRNKGPTKFPVLISLRNFSIWATSALLGFCNILQMSNSQMIIFGHCLYHCGLTSNPANMADASKQIAIVASWSLKQQYLNASQNKCMLLIIFEIQNHKLKVEFNLVNNVFVFLS